MAAAKRKPTAKKKAPAFELDVETRFELTGRGTVTWFQVMEEDDYGKIGGNFFPDDSSRMEGVVADLMAEAQAQADEFGIEVAQVDPIKTNDDGETYYKVNRKAIKANGDDAVIKFRDKSGKNEIDLDDELGNGSTVNIKYYASAYYMAESEPAPGVIVPARIGVSLSPLVVQVIDQKIYDGDSGGFDDESDSTDAPTSNADDAPFDDETQAKDSDY